MRFAVGVPTILEYGNPRLLLDLATSAEEAGWDGFFLWDHLVYRAEGDPVADPWTTLTAVASRTQTIRLGVMVTVLARRRPWKVARETATLDVLSGGRLVFGAGLGSLGREEFAAFGEDPDRRVRAEKLDEALDIVTGLWRGEPYSHEGRHFSVQSTVFRPTPVQVPRIPVWVAGTWPNRRPFRRAARWDGVFPTHASVGPAETMAPEQLREILEYTLTHRPEGSGPFDVIIEGLTPENRKEAAEFVSPYGEVGLTWWIEKIGWFRGSVAEMMRKVKAGPPRSPPG
jgi:alkanesulfonate monooxygenase SsuD/methylene tetrahydromethanopterin reductase-like flavin-dependent oxidoreductase (luciferase family)